MKNDFIVGCNYWASNAGMRTWEMFDESVIDKDFATLSENGVDTIRVFPTWDAFQQVEDLRVNAPLPAALLNRKVLIQGEQKDYDSLNVGMPGCCGRRDRAWTPRRNPFPLHRTGCEGPRRSE